jgi:flagellar biosynthetic protein FliR
MLDIPELPLEPLVAAAMVFSRTAGLLLTFPGFSAVTPIARLGLALPLTIILYPSVENLSLPPTLPVLLGGVLLETLMGVAMGMMVSIFLNAMTVMGETISANIGLHLAQMLDPLTNSRADAFSSIASVLTLALFLVTDTHLRCIEVFAASFQTIPPGTFLSPTAFVPQLVDGVGMTLKVGIALGGPITVFVFLIHLGLSVLGRMAPNLNIFFSIGFSITVAFGMMLAMMALGPTINAFLPMLDESIAQLAAMVGIVR